MVSRVNKKLILGILLTFIVCIGSAILAVYSTGPYGNYPNPGHHPGEIGPGTFNCSGTGSNCYFKFTDDFGHTGLKINNGTTEIYKGLHVAPGYQTIIEGDLHVSGGYYHTIDFSFGYDMFIWKSPNSINASDLVTMLNTGTGGNVVKEVVKWDNVAEEYVPFVVILGIQDFQINNGDSVFVNSAGATTVSVPGDKLPSPVFAYTDSGYSGIFSGGKGLITDNLEVENLNVTGKIIVNTTYVQGGISGSVMYLRNQGTSGNPANCPSGWTQADYKDEHGGESFNHVRTCYRTDVACQVMYLRNQGTSGNPANCPSGWTQADYKDEHGGDSFNHVRTCYKCP